MPKSTALEGSFCEEATKFALTIIKTHFGDLARELCRLLASLGDLSFPEIRVELNEVASKAGVKAFPRKEVANVMLKLSIHSILSCKFVLKRNMEKKFVYRFHVQETLFRLYAARVVAHVQKTLGIPHSVLIKSILANGSASNGDCIKALIEANEAGTEIDAGRILIELKNSRFIRPLPEEIRLKLELENEKMEASSDESDSSDDEGATASKRAPVRGKRVREEEDTSALDFELGDATPGPSKRARLESESEEEDEDEDDDASVSSLAHEQRQQITVDMTDITLWTVNPPTFLKEFRDLAMVDFVSSRIHDSCGLVLRAVIRLNDQDYTPSTASSRAFTTKEIVKGMRRLKVSKKLANEGSVNKALVVMSNDKYSFFRRMVRNSVPTFEADYSMLIETMKKETTLSFVRRTEGPECARILNIVLKKKVVTETVLCKDALLPAKSVRTHCATLVKSGLLGFQEVPRRLDRNPAHMFFLWNVDLTELWWKMRELTCIALRNVFLLTIHEASADAIVETLGQKMMHGLRELTPMIEGRADVHASMPSAVKMQHKELRRTGKRLGVLLHLKARMLDQFSLYTHWGEKL